MLNGQESVLYSRTYGVCRMHKVRMEEHMAWQQLVIEGPFSSTFSKTFSCPSIIQTCPTK
jgi:hypothetical protein